MMSVKPTVIIDNLAFPESPRWHNDRLYVSDWGGQELITLNQQSQRAVVAEIQAFPFCMAFLPDGQLLVVTKNAVSKVNHGGSLELYADLSVISDKGWNDIVADGRGNVYVNGGSDGFAGEPGLIGLITSDGTVKQVADDLAFPNGMAITPDNSTLIVAESYSKVLTAYEIASDGTLSNRRVWAETGEFGPDGICIDAEGAVWCASGQRCLRLREGGEVLQEVPLELFCTACMLGGSEQKTLYMTVVHWDSEETQTELGKIAQSLETGRPAKWSEKRTGQVLSVSAPAAKVGWN